MNARTELPLGLIHGLSNEAYHALPALGASGLKKLKRSPLHLHRAAITEPTPAFSSPNTCAADVIGDSFASRSGDESLHELLRIVGMCAAGRADHELHLRAAGWIAARAAEHALLHQDDLAADLAADMVGAA